jgi:hypothetical protein
VFLVGDDNLIARLPIDAIGHRTDAVGGTSGESNLVLSYVKYRRYPVTGPLVTLEFDATAHDRREAAVLPDQAVGLDDLVGDHSGRGPKVPLFR